MARKKIREYDSKRLLKQHLKRLAGIDLQIRSAQVSLAVWLISAISMLPSYFSGSTCLFLILSEVHADVVPSWHLLEFLGWFQILTLLRLIKMSSFEFLHDDLVLWFCSVFFPRHWWLSHNMDVSAAKAVWNLWFAQSFASFWLQIYGHSYENSCKVAKTAFQLIVSLSVLQVTQSTDFTELVNTETWLSSTRLVVKPDMLFGKRGKSGLVALNLDVAQVAQFVKERLGVEVIPNLVSLAAGYLIPLLIMPCCYDCV